MSSCSIDLYTLPTIDFVGGSTQDLLFRVYFYQNKRPFGLSGCTANFSVVDYLDRTGAPIISKAMTVKLSDDGTIDNVLSVTLSPTDTVNLFGKYVYQISIQDVDGDVEIPNQGLMYINTNINKSFIKS